jgi:phosphoglycolate phosphatase
MFQNATVVFDLDGTLVDTAPDLTNTLNHILAAHGQAPVAAECVREAVGRGAQAMIKEAFRLNGAQGDLEAMLADFLAHYEANIAVESRPFPGAREALERLTAGGARLAICTNKRERLTRLLLNALDLDLYFVGMAGRDTFDVSKPDPGHVLGAISAAGGSPSRSVMVGDSAVDIRAARGAGVPSIVVSFGYCPPPPEGPQADAVIDHFDALDAALGPLLKRLTENTAATS